MLLMLRVHKRDATPIAEEVAGAEYTLSGDVIHRDAKEEPTRNYPRRAPAKSYGVLAAGCTKRLDAKV